MKIWSKFCIYNFEDVYYLIGDNEWVPVDWYNFRLSQAIKMANIFLLDKVVVSIYPDLLPLYNVSVDSNVEVSRICWSTKW